MRLKVAFIVQDGRYVSEHRQHKDMFQRKEEEESVGCGVCFVSSDGFAFSKGLWQTVINGGCDAPLAAAPR